MGSIILHPKESLFRSMVPFQQFHVVLFEGKRWTFVAGSIVRSEQDGLDNSLRSPSLHYKTPTSGSVAESLDLEGDRPQGWVGEEGRQGGR